MEISGVSIKKAKYDRIRAENKTYPLSKKTFRGAGLFLCCTSNAKPLERPGHKPAFYIFAAMGKQKGIKYIIRKRGMGDVLWIEPVIRAYAQQYRKIVVYTKFPDLFKNIPYTHVVVKSRLSLIEKIGLSLAWFPTIRKRVLNLDNSYEQQPQMHMLHAYQQKAGLPFSEEYPRLYGYDTRLKNSHSPYVVLHLESLAQQNYRNVYGIVWPDIITYLNHLNFEVIQIGNSITPLPGAKWVPTNQLPDLIQLIAQCHFFIGIDSGPSHIAASLGKPSLIFFGSVNPEFRHFRSLFKGYFLQQYCEFAGCYHTVNGNRGVTCRLVGDAGIPKCCLHSNDYLIRNINKLLETYVQPAETDPKSTS